MLFADALIGAHFALCARNRLRPTLRTAAVLILEKAAGIFGSDITARELSRCLNIPADDD
jgi:hypothetical protein